MGLTATRAPEGKLIEIRQALQRIRTLFQNDIAILGGRSGGQILHGGLGAGDDLTLRGTANASPGDVFIADNGGKVAIGHTSPTSIFHIKESSRELKWGATGGTESRLSILASDGDMLELISTGSDSIIASDTNDIRIDVKAVSGILKITDTRLDIANQLRVGTVTDTASAGDFSAGLDSACHIVFDQSLQTFLLIDSSDSIAARLSGVAGTSNALNADQLDIDTNIEGSGAVLAHFDAGDLRVGIKTNLPGSTLDVRGGDLRVGTVTDTSGSGDFSAGLDSASRIVFTQSLQTFILMDSGDATAARLSGVAGTPNVLNGDQLDIDTRIEGVGAELAFFDAGLLAVGIGSTGPAAKLHVDQGSLTGAKPVLLLDQADIDEDYIKIIGTSDASADRALVDAANFTTPGAIKGWLKINVQDDQVSGPIADGDYFVPFYSVPTA